MVRIGIVGTRGLSFAKAINEIPERAKVTACCDLDEGALARARETFGEIKTYRIYEEMISSGEIDAVIISTPMQYHVPQAIEALGAGIITSSRTLLRRSRAAFSPSSTSTRRRNGPQSRSSRSYPSRTAGARWRCRVSDAG